MEAAAKRKAGRPKGSLNKPKAAPVLVEAPVVEVEVVEEVVEEVEEDVAEVAESEVEEVEEAPTPRKASRHPPPSQGAEPWPRSVPQSRATRRVLQRSRLPGRRRRSGSPPPFV